MCNILACKVLLLGPVRPTDVPTCPPNSPEQVLPTMTILYLTGNSVTQPGDLTSEWKHENHAPNTVNTPRSCHCQLEFMGPCGATGWHGSIQILNDGAMLLQFNARFREPLIDNVGLREQPLPLRPTLLYPIHAVTGESKWTGSDYRARQITLTRQRTFCLDVPGSSNWTIVGHQ